MKLVVKAAFWITLVLAAAMAIAEPVSQLRPTDYVNDFAHVLDPNTIAQLDGICQQIDGKAHAQIAVVTIQSLDGSDIESYAVDLFKQWGIGDKSTKRGVLVLLATQDRRYRTEVGYGLEPILPDGKVGGFGREAAPLLKHGDYNGAVLLLTSRVAEVIAQDAGAQLTGAQPSMPAESPEAQHSNFPILLLLAVFVVVMLIPPLRRLLFWFLLFNMGGGWGGGGRGGGGFGGGGGGGFGGGSSGGGGASGSW
ncbi:MAG: TPM domain-containing protein [Terriglobales bacterium]